MKLIDPFNKAVFHLDRVNDYLQGKPVYPVSVEVDLSDSCNLNCSWCRFSHGHAPNYMSIPLAQTILGDLWNCGIKSIVYSGGGEPTMNPDFERILRYGAALGLDQGVYTNGTGLKCVSKVLDATTKFVYVSIDAASPETYENIKGINCYEKVIRGTQHLCQSKRKTKVGIGFLISPQNMAEIERAPELLQTRADYMQFRPAVGTLTLEQAEEAYERAKAVANDQIIVAEYKFEDLIDHLKGGGRAYDQCHAHNFLGGISADGSVWFCLNHRYEEGFKIGDMTTQNFREIWSGGAKRAVAGTLDVQKCPLLCRPHELNKFLHILKTAQNDHKNFL